MRTSKTSHIINARVMRAVFCKHSFNAVFQFSNKLKHHSDKSRNIHLCTI